MSNFYQTYPQQSVPKYATLSLFPPAATAGNGAFGVALDSDILYVSNGSTWIVSADPAATGGTVTSVAMSVPTFLSVAGSPVTTAGTLAVSLSGTALPVANGGTGVTSLGTLSDVGTDGIVVTGGTGAVITNTSIAQHVADSTHNGYLSSTDWSTFNNKGAGSVTSVAATVPSVFSISGSPITGAGTLAMTYSGTALPVANGGTGLTSGTSGGILGYTASGTLASSGVLTASQLILGGGAGVTPSTLAAGTQYQPLVMGATTPGYGALNLAQSAAVTGVLPNANTTATNANTASTIVARDGSGNFTAGSITAALLGNATTATTASTVTTNANLTGVITSVGNATSIASQTGTGTKFVVDTSPTLVTPILGTPTSGTLSNCTTLKGITTGSAVAAGIIGEVLSSTSFGGAINVSNTIVALGSLPLTAGVWSISVMCFANGSPANTLMYFNLNTTSASTSGCVSGYDQFYFALNSTNAAGMGSFTKTVSISGSTTYYLNVNTVIATPMGAGGVLGSLIGTRIG